MPLRETLKARGRRITLLSWRRATLNRLFEAWRIGEVAAVVVVASVLGGCPPGVTSPQQDAGASELQEVPASGTGYFVDEPIGGLLFTRFTRNSRGIRRPVGEGFPGQSASVTTPDGRYYWSTGEEVEFHVGPIPLGSAKARTTMTLADLRRSVYDAERDEDELVWTSREYGYEDSPAETDARIVNQARLLLSLDAPGTPGLQVDPAVLAKLHELFGQAPGDFPVAFHANLPACLDEPCTDVQSCTAQPHCFERVYDFMLDSLNEVLEPDLPRVDATTATEHLRESLRRPTQPEYLNNSWSVGGEECEVLWINWGGSTFDGELVERYRVYARRHFGPVWDEFQYLTPFSEITFGADPTDRGFRATVAPDTYEIVVAGVSEGWIEGPYSEQITVVVPPCPESPPPSSDGGSIVPPPDGCQTRPFTGPLGSAGDPWEFTTTSPGDLLPSSPLRFVFTQDQCSSHNTCSQSGSRSDFHVELRSDGTGFEQLGSGASVEQFEWGLIVDPETECDPLVTPFDNPLASGDRYNLVFRRTSNPSDGWLATGFFALFDGGGFEFLKHGFQGSIHQFEEGSW